MTATSSQATGDAAFVVRSLEDADLIGKTSGILTEAERTLISGVCYRLKHRLGERRSSLVMDLHALGTGLIGMAAADIEREVSS